MSHTNAPRPLQLNCPKCPRQMRYHGILQNGARVYSCDRHGEWHLAQGGLFQADDKRAKQAWRET